MAAFFRFYQTAFDTRPYTTLVCANASLNALGDMIAQTAQITLAKREPDTSKIPPLSYDISRTIRFAIFGAAMGPVIGRWLKLLEYRFPLRPTSGQANILTLGKRVVSDQTVMAPLGLVAFIGAMGVMERRTTAEIKQKYADLYAPALLANWMVWPFAQTVNFRFMPLAYRVPFQASCGVLWTLYLSLLNSDENKHIEEYHGSGGQS